LLIEGFETFDRDVAPPFATDIGNHFASAASIFGAGGMGERIRLRVIENRRNLIAAAYGLSRRDVLGYCGDEIVEVYRRTTPGSELRTLGGVTINRSEGVDVFVRAPRRFAPFVEASHFESGEGHFAEEIRRLGGCESPLLRHVEDNLVNYARGLDFIRWSPSIGLTRTTRRVAAVTPRSHCRLHAARIIPPASGQPQGNLGG
jgi:hypothetical protein